MKHGMKSSQHRVSIIQTFSAVLVALVSRMRAANRASSEGISSLEDVSQSS